MISSKIRQQLILCKQQINDRTQTHSVFFKRELDEIYESLRKKDDHSEEDSANQLKDDVTRLERLLDKYDRFDMHKAFLRQCLEEEVIPTDMEIEMSPPALAKNDKEFMISWQMRLDEFSAIVIKDIVQYYDETVVKISHNIEAISGKLKTTLSPSEYIAIIEAVTGIQKLRLERLTANNENDLEQLRYKRYAKKNPVGRQNYMTICYGVKKTDSGLVGDNRSPDNCEKNGKLVRFKDKDIHRQNKSCLTNKNKGTVARMQNRNRGRNLQAVKDQVLKKELREGIKERKIIPITKINDQSQLSNETGRELIPVAQREDSLEEKSNDQLQLHNNRIIQERRIAENKEEANKKHQQKHLFKGFNSKKKLRKENVDKLKQSLEEKMKFYASQDFEDKLGDDYIEDSEDEYKTNSNDYQEFLESITTTLPATIEYFERRFNHKSEM